MNNDSLKKSILDFLNGSEQKFENSKAALEAFEKQTGRKASVIYFGRIFSTAAKRETKKAKVKEFLQTTNYPTCQKAFEAYTQQGGQAANIYFSRVYTEVRKENKVSKTFSFEGKSAREIMDLVSQITKVQMTENPKNKQSIIKKATSILTNQGFVIA